MRIALVFLACFPGAAVARPGIPVIDLAVDSERITLVDREKGQYLGHVSTCLLDDGKTILTVYPKGHGRGPIVYKKSINGGNSWGRRLPTPASWATSKEVPTLHRMEGPDGKKRIILWSGLYPARFSVSEDEGRTWSELKKAGDWGGIVVMGDHMELKTGKGHVDHEAQAAIYVAMLRGLDSNWARGAHGKAGLLVRYGAKDPKPLVTSVRCSRRELTTLLAARNVVAAAIEKHNADALTETAPAVLGDGRGACARCYQSEACALRTFAWKAGLLRRFLVVIGRKERRRL